MARPDEVVDLTFDLFATLGATDEQLDFPYLYAIAKDAVAVRDLNDEKKDIQPLIEFIKEHVKPAERNEEDTFKMQPASLAYDNFVGRLAVGRVYSGQISVGSNVTVITNEGERRQRKISKIFTFSGMNKVEVNSAKAGDQVAIAGIDDIYVSQTITDDPMQSHFLVFQLILLLLQLSLW